MFGGTNKWSKYYNAYYSGLYHGSFTGVTNHDDITLGNSGTSIQLINNKLNILTAPAFYNVKIGDFRTNDRWQRWNLW
jgi:hypothetical protein